MRILLCDSQTLFRTGLARLLERENDLDVVASVETVGLAVEAAMTLEPDVVITDAFLPDGSASDLAAALPKRTPPIRIVVVPAILAPGTRAQSRVGAIVSRSVGIDQLLNALRHPERPPEDVGTVDTVAPLELPEGRTPLDLSRQERHLLQLVAAGYGNRHIARVLELREKTVRNKLTSLYERLGVRSRTQAALAVLRLGLAVDDPPDGDV